jgi:hypothetical protein
LQSVEAHEDIPEFGEEVPAVPAALLPGPEPLEAAERCPPVERAPSVDPATPACSRAETVWARRRSRVKTDADSSYSLSLAIASASSSSWNRVTAPTGAKISSRGLERLAGGSVAFAAVNEVGDALHRRQPDGN